MHAQVFRTDDGGGQPRVMAYNNGFAAAHAPSSDSTWLSAITFEYQNVVRIPSFSRRQRHLITAAWLADLQCGKAVTDAPAGDWRLFEVDFGAPDRFSQGHIAGAGYIDTNLLEQEPLWNKVSDQALLRLLLENGIRHDTTVVLYAHNTLAAARAAHLLLYAGVDDVRLLDGGLAAWSAAGLALTAGTPHRTSPITDFGAVFPARPDYLIDTQQVKSLLQEADGSLVSIRSWDEFIGATSGYSYIDVKGDIAGARWGRAGADVNSMSDFHNPDGTMKTAAEISVFWEQPGIHCDRPTAFYCGTGWRASVAFFYAWLMNWERISVYDGRWFEWSRDPDNPIARGVR